MPGYQYARLFAKAVDLKYGGISSFKDIGRKHRKNLGLDSMVFYSECTEK